MPQVDTEFEDIVEAARQSNLIKSPYFNIMKRKYRPQLIIACIFMIFQQFDGINAIIFYAPVLFEGIAGGSKGALLNTVVVNLGAYVIRKAALCPDQASVIVLKQARFALYESGWTDRGVLCAVNVFATFGAIAFVDRLGRRKLLLIASAHMFVMQVVVAGLLGAEFEKFGAGLPTDISVALLVVCCTSLSFVTFVCLCAARCRWDIWRV